MQRATKISIGLVCLGAGAVAVPRADAHFSMTEPKTWLVQNGSGDPQKTGPCGMETGAVQTNDVTTYKTGDKVTIKFTETIAHTGHYRVLLAATQAALPPAPSCANVTINPTPTPPLLADGLLVHDENASPLVGEQTVQVTLPPGFTCDHCVLQVQEYMAGRATGCFYFHCSTINVTADGTPPPPGPDAGPGVDPGGGPGTTTGGCAAAGGGSLALAGLVLGLLARRRRR